MTETNISTQTSLPLNEITDNIRKRAYQTYFFWLLVIIGLAITIYFLFDFQYPAARHAIYSLLIAVVTVDWVISIPYLGILLLIFLRTRSRNFFTQFFPSFILLILVTVVMIFSLLDIPETSPWMPLYLITLTILAALEIILLYFQIEGVKTNKKPLFFWTFFQDTLESYTSSFLSQQALQINDYQDGYSQRPYFQEYTELTTYFSSLSEYQTKMEAYARFLSEKSELVGWDVNGNKVILYPRVLLGHADFGMGLRYLWDLLLKIIRKKQTNITLDYELQEISIHIDPDDYHLLGDVTYFILGQKIIELFKCSISAFISDDPDRAYFILFPRRK